MKYWRIGRTECGYGENGLILKGDSDHIVSFRKINEGFEIREECDGNFSEIFTKKEVLELVEELKEWITNQ